MKLIDSYGYPGEPRGPYEVGLYERERSGRVSRSYPMSDKFYTNLIGTTELPWCWACGRGQIEQPDNWNATWILNRAHLSAGSGGALRIESREHVNLLCPLCHSLHRHRPTQIKFGYVSYPALTDANMIWLKMTRDPQFYNPQQIATAWIGIPPDPEQPHDYFMEQYELRHGGVL